MKIYQDLYITLNGASIDELVEKLEQTDTHWIRAREREKDLRDMGEQVFAFEYKKNGEVLAGLSLFHKEAKIWYVPNIVPLKETSLSIDEYNKLLNDFAGSAVKPSIIDTDITAEVTPDSLLLESYADGKLEELLNRFSGAANKSTLNSHPCDKKRWFEFVVAAANESEKIPTDLVVTTLLEQGWTESAADELAVQYEYSIELLHFVRGV